MLDTHQPDHVIDVIQHIFDGSPSAGPDEIADHGHADDSALPSRTLNGIIGLTARAVRNQRPAIGVSDEHRLPRGFDGV